MDPKTATVILHGLVYGGRELPLPSRVSAEALSGMKFCIDAGADLSGLVDIGEGRFVSLLALSVKRPEAGILLLRSGAPVHEDIVERLALCRSAWNELDGVDKAFRDFAVEVAAASSHLHWYALKANPQGSFYEKTPSALVVEEFAPGFNEALEAAQVKAGLPVGRIPRMSKEEREEALPDLVSIQPDRFYLGDKPIKGVLRSLLKDDISPDMVAEERGYFPAESQKISLLDSMVENQCRYEMVEALIELGATVSIYALEYAIGTASKERHLWRGDEMPESGKMLMLLLSHRRDDLDTYRVKTINHQDIGSLREYLGQEVPEALALLEAQALKVETEPARQGLPARPRF